ncbi:hypothetical protein Ancab_000909 [Ancistrocladus abbreviatus]
MFDGVQDQFHQFLASSRANNPNSLPSVPLSFSLYSSNSPTYHAFDVPFPPPPPAPHPQQLFPTPHLIQTLHYKEDHEEKEAISGLLTSSLVLEKGRLMPDSIDPWSNEEVLALLRIRSSMETWFPDFTWEHVSRKLAEVGFKRSAEKCKEKFEEENRYLNSINCSKNYRLFGELEELYHGDHHHQYHHHNNQIHDPQTLCHYHDKDQNANDVQNEKGEEEEEDNRCQRLENDTTTDKLELGEASQSVDSEKMAVEDKNKRSMNKRKKHKKYEMFKGFCESIVSTMMAHQEELHNKILEDMVRRDEQKIAREEAWKKQEMERITKELEFRAHQQAIAGSRQAKIIEFLKEFTSNANCAPIQSECLGERVVENSNFRVPNTTSSSSILSEKTIATLTPTSSNVSQVNQNPSLLATQNSPNLPTSPNDEDQASQNPNSMQTQDDQQFAPISFPRHKSPKRPTNSTASKQNVEREDIGKRWPRDEVLVLINIRCSLYKANGNDGEGNCNTKGPLWERISKSMLELGYKRSAKRCKEKWENINKYFRKTKDINKKRSIDSRTCPYFHQLSYLYSQGTISMGPSDRPENVRSGSPVNWSTMSENGEGSVGQGGSHGGASATVHTSEVKDHVVQVPASYDFEF